jgi:hypothetical protein
MKIFPVWVDCHVCSKAGDQEGEVKEHGTPDLIATFKQKTLWRTLRLSFLPFHASSEIERRESLAKAQGMIEFVKEYKPGADSTSWFHSRLPLCLPSFCERVPGCFDGC